MDAWLAHLTAIHSPRPTTRTVVGGARDVPAVSFDTHLTEAMAKPAPVATSSAAWGDVYLREAGLLFGAPAVGSASEQEHPVRARRVDPTHAA